MTSPPLPATSLASFSVDDEANARRVSDLLSESLDQSECAVAAFERSDKLWGITLHFAEPPDQGAVRALVEMTAGDAAADGIVFDTIASKDWVKASLEGLAPVAAGRFIVHGAHDRARVPPNRIRIEIEAALAFGTGHHGTTRGCLLLLDRVLRARSPQRVLDLGTGTGVLAIAAAKALRRRVLASDIDAQSVRVATDNARHNGAGNWVEAVHATGFAAPEFRVRAPFDLVLANILANPLRQLAPRMASHLAPAADVILSGLLSHQTRGVVAAYRAAGLMLVRRIEIEGWCSLWLRSP